MCYFLLGVPLEWGDIDGPLLRVAEAWRRDAKLPLGTAPLLARAVADWTRETAAWVMRPAPDGLPDEFFMF